MVAANFIFRTNNNNFQLSVSFLLPPVTTADKKNWIYMYIYILNGGPKKPQISYCTRCTLNTIYMLLLIQHEYFNIIFIYATIMKCVYIYIFGMEFTSAITLFQYNLRVNCFYCCCWCAYLYLQMALTWAFTRTFCMCSWLELARVRLSLAEWTTITISFFHFCFCFHSYICARNILTITWIQTDYYCQL